MEQTAVKHIVDVLEEQLTRARNPERAVQAEAYMKNRFAFFGMPMAERRAVQKEWLRAVNSDVTDRKDRWQLIRALWDRPEREFHYAAIDWLNSWPKKWYDPNDAGELEFLIRTHSWWDSVDAIASNYLGKWERLYPEKARETFENWRHSDSIWLQRSCLIYQLKHKDAVDVPYLESLIVQLLPVKEFFIQKAIGWSLRQLSKTDPEAVREILGNHPVQGLALREASKYL